MKIVAAGNSKNLRKEDVPHPFIAIISDIRVQTFEKTARSPREDKDMLHFTDPSIKPLGLNVTNKRIIIAAYGDESDNWRGQPVEIYVDPNVPNSSGQIVGGIRLRIPAAADSRPAAAIGTAPAPAPKAAQAPRPMPALQAPRSAAEVTRTAAEVAQAIEGMNHAQDHKNLDEWRSWGMAIAGTTQAQKDVMQAASDHAQERIALATAPATPRRPVLARK
jgi:hypothetical protein